VTALDARLAELASDLRREWAHIRANLARARSTEPALEVLVQSFVQTAG
jgi:hypothetical protein